MRRHLTYANVVATLALVFAVGGGTAVAAKVITGKQIKNGSIGTKDLSAKARKALKGQKGAKGAAGARGAQGAPGAAGAAGASGANGATGARGFSSWHPIPSGQLVTGVERFDVEGGRASSDFHFTINLPGVAPAELDNEAVNFAPGGNAGAVGDADSTCTGTAAAPTAPPGKMCLYLVVHAGIAAPGPTGAGLNNAFGRQRAGKVMWFGTPAVNADSLVEFTWAYRAP